MPRGTSNANFHSQESVITSNVLFCLNLRNDKTLVPFPNDYFQAALLDRGLVERLSELHVVEAPRVLTLVHTMPAGAVWGQRS